MTPKSTKIYCQYCKTNDETDRIFDANPNADICFCPNCGHKIKTADGAKNYKSRIDTLLKRAGRKLNYRTDYLSAYKAYGYVLKLDPDNILARNGRMASLLRMSTVRSSRFLDVGEMLKVEEDCHFPTNNDDFRHSFGFLILAYRLGEQYIAVLHKRLVYKKLYYDLDCVSLIVRRIEEVMVMDQEILTAMLAMEKKLPGLPVRSKADVVEKGIKTKKDFLSGKFTLQDGSVISYIGSRSADGSPILTETKPKKADGRKVKHSLHHKSDSRLVKIKDRIFRNDQPLFIISSLFTVLGSAFFLLTVAGCVLMALYPEHIILIAIASGVSLALAVSLFVSKFMIGKWIQKKAI